MPASDPAVTITFSGDGNGAIQAANAVSVALDNLSVKSRSAQAGLSAVSRVMDDVSARSAKVASIGAAYQSASVGIINTLNATRASGNAFGFMASAADAAQKRVANLNATISAQPKMKPGAAPGTNTPSPASGGGSSAGVMGGASLTGMARMAATTIGVSVGLATVGTQVKALIDANMDLDKAMSSVAAVGNLDKLSGQYKELTALVVDLGGKTQYSAAEAAGGLKELVAGGYAASEAALMLKDTLSLAATENMALGRASEIVVAGLQSFRLGVDQTTRLTDVLARGANASTASIDGLGEAFKYLAPVSAAMNVSLEESAAVVAILANNGLQAGLAGRGMSAIMSRMIAPSKDAQAVLKKFGVTLAEINPAIAGLGGAMKALEKVDTGGLVTLFGAENLDVSNVLKANASGFSAMVGQMKDVSITAEGMAAKKNDNGAGDFKKLSAAIQEVRVELGKDLYEGMRGHVQSFTTYLHENKDAIVSTIKQVTSLAVSLTPLVGALIAVKAVSLTGSLIASAAAWGSEAMMVRADTVALEQNAAARVAVKGGMTKFVGAGAAVGGLVGYNSAPETAGTGEKIGRTVAGAVIGGGAAAALQALGPMAMNAIVSGVTASGTAISGAATAAFAPAMTAITTSTVGGAGAMSALATAGTAAAAGFAALAVSVAAVGFGIGYLMSDTVQGWVFGETVTEAADKASDSINGLGNDMISAAAAGIQGAQDQAALDKARLKINNDIMATKSLIAGLENQGADATDIDSAKTTLQVLEQKHRLAQKIFDKAQAIALAEREQAAGMEMAAQRAKNFAEELYEAEMHAANLLEASKEMTAGLPDFAKKVVESLPDEEAMNIYKGQEANAAAAATDARKAIESALAKSGADMSLIDPARTIKDADDVVAYVRTVMGMVQKNDNGKGNLLGLPEVAALKKAAEDAMEAGKNAKGKKTSVDSKLENEKRVTQELAGVQAEIAINEAKAAGDTKLAEKLEREKSIMEEKLKLQALLMKGHEDGTVGEKAAITKTAEDLATKKVDSEIAAKKPVNGEVKAMSLGAQGINTFFGRSANDGVFDEAKKHTTLLTKVVTLLTPKNQLEGEPKQYIPTFSKY